MRLQEIEARLLEIRMELETRGESMTPDEVTAFETEVTALTGERAGIMAAAEQRRAMLANIAVGDTESDVIGRMTGADAVADRFDTPQYQRAFMEFVCRGTPVPAEFSPTALELRADAATSTGDVGAVIPTTIMNEILREAKTYGNIYNGVRHLNIQGGVAFPILTLMPAATWIGEKETSDRQKLQAKDSVTFSYYGLECRISQTLLVSVVTIAEFQKLFIPLAAEAMVKALEISIVKGTGKGQMLGVTNESRIPAANKIILTPAEMASWGDWKKKVFAKMKKSYRNGVFIMAQGTFDANIDGMTDTTGQPIGRVNYGIDGGETYRFGGRRIEIVEDEIIPAYEDAEEGAIVAVFMRLSDYAINTNMQMRVVRWYDHDKNEYVNKAILIADGKVLDPHGILLITKGK